MSKRLIDIKILESDIEKIKSKYISASLTAKVIWEKHEYHIEDYLGKKVIVLLDIKENPYFKNSSLVILDYNKGMKLLMDNENVDIKKLLIDISPLQTAWVPNSCLLNFNNKIIFKNESP